ncbi:MAG: RDD family protein [Geobacteraceae bacterium]|nr:RDD family protein [Geobacteraceae bacterium]
MRVECPHCGAKGKIDESRRPPGAVIIRCPRCKGSIPLDDLLPESTASATGVGHALKTASIANRADAAVPGGVSGAEPDDRQFCSVCNRRIPRKDMTMFGPALVCVSCKPAYVQNLEQGGTRPGSLRYAGFCTRLCAKSIDSLILVAVMGALYLVIFLVLSGSFSIKPQGTNPELLMAAMVIWYMIVVALPVAMGTFFVGRFGATPGKMAVGLVVVNPEGDRISCLRALGRCLAEMLSGFFCCIGYLLMFFDAEKRTLHDMICQTRVVYK